MVRKKRLTKIIFIKFLKNNPNILKKFRKNNTFAKYSRDPRMMKCNPSLSEVEESIKMEEESF